MILLELLDSIKISNGENDGIPSATINDHQCHTEYTESAISNHHLFGFENIVSSLLSEVMTVMLPIAVNDRVSMNISPYSGMLLTGKRGSGKSNLLREVSIFIRQNSSFQIHIEFIDCKLFRKTPINDVITKINNIFNTANKRSPSLIILDNIDSLCPFNQETGVGTLSDERTCVITFCIERWMKICHNKLVNSHEEAFDYYLQNNNSIDKQSLSSIAIHPNVFVIATAQSLTSVRSELLQKFCFRKVFEVPSLNSTARLSYLELFLNRLGIKLNAINNNDRQLEEEKIESITEGFTIAEIVTLSNRIKSIIYSDALIANNQLLYKHDHIVITWRELIDICESIHSGSSSTSSSGGLNEVVGFDNIKYEIINIMRSFII